MTDSRTAALLLALAASGCRTDPGPQLALPQPRASVTPRACAGEPADPWLSRSTLEQVEAAASGALCCADLTDAYLERISTDPVNAIIATDASASARAVRLDAASEAGELHCAVVAVKDNIDVAGMANTAGSLAMVDNMIHADAPAMAGLRAAGAVLIAKANLSEWANGRGWRSTSGWSSVGGQTLNGANPAYNPCGSSSGSAAAVAAGLVSASIGTETSGSIVCPASVNGVVGFKPTLGLVSRTGIVPLAHSFDTPGPITRTVLDAAAVLSAMAGADEADPATHAIPPAFDFELVAQAEEGTLSDARLGWSPTYVEGLPRAQSDIFRVALAEMSSAGAVVVEIDLPDAESLSGPFERVLTTELAAGLDAYLSTHAAPGVPTSLEAIIAFNEAHAAQVMPHFGQEFFLAAQATTGVDDPDYLVARQRVLRQAGPEGLLTVLDSHRLDAIVLPTMGVAWKTNHDAGDRFSGPSAAFLPAAAGYPHLTVPMAELDGLPLGLSFIGRPWLDGALLGLGHAYEVARPSTDRSAPRSK